MKALKEDSVPSPNRIWYNEWVEKNAKGNVLDVGKSKFWDYGFPTIDIVKGLNPTYAQDICDSNLASDFCNCACSANQSAVVSTVLAAALVLAVLATVGVLVLLVVVAVALLLILLCILLLLLVLLFLLLLLLLLLLLYLLLRRRRCLLHWRQCQCQRSGVTSINKIIRS
jgi:hypothetical protein